VTLVWQIMHDETPPHLLETTRRGFAEPSQKVPIIIPQAPHVEREFAGSVPDAMSPTRLKGEKTLAFRQPNSVTEFEFRWVLHLAPHSMQAPASAGLLLRTARVAWKTAARMPALAEEADNDEERKDARCVNHARQQV
jgi:hypothetical protein